MPSTSIPTQERKRVLVTGGAGYIGSHVVLELFLTGRYLPVVLDNGHNSKSTAVRRIEEIARDELGDDTLPSIDLHECDLTNPSAVEGVFERYKNEGGVWGVVHIAAWKAVGESGERPLKYYQNNVSATITLLDIMSAYGTKHIVYSSSATVYGIPATIPIPEDTPIAPESCYGRTKAVCEGFLRDLAKADPELRACSLRYFNPAGAHPSGKIGEDPRGKPGNLIPLLAAMAVGRFTEGGLKVFGDDYPTVDGTCVRDYLHIIDLARGHVLALDGIASGKVFASPSSSSTPFSSSTSTTSPATALPSSSSSSSSSPPTNGRSTTSSVPLPPSCDPPTMALLANGVLSPSSTPIPPSAESQGHFKAYNLGRGQAYSVLQIVAAMSKATGCKYEYEIVGRRDGDVPDLTADPSLAQKELGFIATRGLDEACNDLWRWQQGNPNGYDNPSSSP